MRWRVGGKRLERDVMAEIAEVLPLCNKIARVWRQNVGQVEMPDGRIVRFGEPGISDYIGYLKDGRFLAIEAKRPDGRLSPEQRVFLDSVNANGGLGFVARCAEDVLGRLRS